MKKGNEIWGTLRTVLDRMEQAVKDHVTRTYMNQVGQPGGPPDTTIAQALIDGRHKAISRQYDRLRRRDYFPFSRFGRFAVLVKATKPVRYKGRVYAPGRTLRMETWESYGEGLEGLKDLEEQYKGNSAVKVKYHWLTEEEYSWSGFPPSLYEDLKVALGLDSFRSEVLTEIYLSRSPGSGFVKHLRRRRGVEGFSRDAMRAYADYMMHASNHLARLEHGWELTEAIKEMQKWIDAQPRNAVKMGQLKDYMSRHFKYLMNPTGDMGALRAIMFSWYFAWVPKQVLVNLTQVPAYTFPYLSKRYGTAAAVREIVQAYKDITGQYIDDKRKTGRRRLTVEEDQLLGRGQEEGFLDQSYATHVAGTAEGGISWKFLPQKYLKGLRDANFYVKSALDAGTTWFRMSEEYNRRVAYLAAVRLAKRSGQDLDGQFRAGRDTVDTTMFEYGRWNRPEFMRDKKAVLFVFQNYLQHSLFFALTNQGGWKFWLMMFILGGMKGIPGEETGRRSLI